MELQIKNLPVSVKSQVLTNFSNIERSRFYRTDPNFKSSVENIKTQIMQHGDHDMLSKYLLDIDQRRGINHINYLGIKLT
jgi:hypothetical protein